MTLLNPSNPNQPVDPNDPFGYEKRKKEIAKMHKLEEKKQTKGLTNEEDATLKNLQAKHAEDSSDPKVRRTANNIWEQGLAPSKKQKDKINKLGLWSAVRIEVPEGGTSSQEKLPTMEEAIENAMRTFGRISELLQKPKGEQDQ